MQPETAKRCLDVKDFILFAAIHPPNDRNDKLPFIRRRGRWLEAVGKAASQFYEVNLCEIYYYFLFNDFNSGYRSNNISAGRSPDRSGSISITWLGIILVMLQSVPKSWK